jgi:hypothetical protein
MDRVIEWSSSVRKRVVVTKDIARYATAASLPIAVVIGGEDTERQPERPAHIGENRIDFAHSWIEAMNRLAQTSGLSAKISFIEVQGVGHNSEALTPAAAAFLFEP